MLGWLGTRAVQNTPGVLDRIRHFNSELDRLMRIHTEQRMANPDFFREVTKTASASLQVARAAIWELTTDPLAITCSDLFEREQNAHTQGGLLWGADYPTYFRALMNCRVIDASHALTDPRTREFARAYLKDYDIHSLLDAQIRSASGPRGVVCFESVGVARTWTPDEIAFAASLAELVGLAIDREERSRVLAALEDSNRQLEQAAIRAEAASTAKSAFLATMSHEIRTPMNGVLGMVQALGHTDLTGDQRQMVSVIEEAGAFLMKVLNDVLDFSRIEAGQFEIEQIPFSLADIGERIKSLQGLRADEKGLDLVVDGFDTWRIGDPARILQIVNNLTHNAVKFTDTGSVRVRCIPGELEDGTPLVTFEIADTGIGMNPEQLGRIFNRFTQASSSTTHCHGGSGLGLTIVRGLVDAMDGQVDVDSEPGRGSVFRVRLPLAPTADLQPAPRPHPASHNGDWLKDLVILAAEDNEINQLVLRSMLEPFGAHLTMTNNGQEAVSYFRSNPVDLVLMDIQMPVMGGEQAFKAIRAVEAEARLRSTDAPGRAMVPVIAMTANSMTHQVDHYLTAGFDGHVAKPIDLATMLTTIREAVDRARIRMTPANDADRDAAGTDAGVQEQVAAGSRGNGPRIWNGAH